MDNMNHPYPPQGPPPQGPIPPGGQEVPPPSPVQQPWPLQSDGGAYYMMVQPQPPAPHGDDDDDRPFKVTRPLVITAIVVGCVLVLSLVLNVVQFNVGGRWRQEAAAHQEEALAQQARADSAEMAAAELEEQLAELARQAEALEKNLDTLTGESEALAQKNAELQEMLAEAQAGGTTLTPEMAYVNIMDYTKLAVNFAGVLYHEYGCSKLDTELYAGMPVALVDATAMEPCPECH